MSTPEWQEHEARRRYDSAPVSPPSGSADGGPLFTDEQETALKQAAYAAHSASGGGSDVFRAFCACGYRSFGSPQPLCSLLRAVRLTRSALAAQPPALETDETTRFDPCCEDCCAPDRPCYTHGIGVPESAQPAARREGAEPDDHFVEPLTVELTARWLADGAEHYENGKGDALQAALFRRAERVVRALAARATGGVPSAVDLAVDCSRSSPLSADTATGSARSAPAPEGVETRTALDEALRNVENLVGCGDHSCLFRKPTGMGTNGGCRCARRPGFADRMAALYRAILAAPRSGAGEDIDTETSDGQIIVSYDYYQRLLRTALAAQVLADSAFQGGHYTGVSSSALAALREALATPLSGGPHGR